MLILNTYVGITGIYSTKYEVFAEFCVNFARFIWHFCNGTNVQVGYGCSRNGHRF
jgi:hypothetical protein